VPQRDLAKFKKAPIYGQFSQIRCSLFMLFGMRSANAKACRHARMRFPSTRIPAAQRSNGA
jgi:hypothetical protein